MMGLCKTGVEQTTACILYFPPR